MMRLRSGLGTDSSEKKNGSHHTDGKSYDSRGGKDAVQLEQRLKGTSSIVSIRLYQAFVIY